MLAKCYVQKSYFFRIDKNNNPPEVDDDGADCVRTYCCLRQIILLQGVRELAQRLLLQGFRLQELLLFCVSGE